MRLRHLLIGYPPQATPGLTACTGGSALKTSRMYLASISQFEWPEAASRQLKAERDAQPFFRRHP